MMMRTVLGLLNNLETNGTHSKYYGFSIHDKEINPVAPALFSSKLSGHGELANNGMSNNRRFAKL